MIKLFLILFLIYLSLVGYSLLFKKLIINSTNYYFHNLDIFYGLFFVLIIAITLNFFIPLEYYGYIFAPIGIFLLILLKKNYIFNNNFYSLFLFIFFFIFLSYSNSNLLAGDTSFYHLQTIKWFSKYKISFGLVNLEPRYGMNSLWHILISIFNLPILNINPIYYFNLILYAITFNEFYNKENNSINKTSVLFLYLILIFLLIYSFIHPMINGTIFLNLGSPEVDTVCMLLFFLSGYLFLKIEKLDNENYVNLILILVTICVLTKLSYIFSILFLFYIFYNKKKFLRLNLIPYVILINILWIIRNLIISGCAIFPLKITCFNFNWAYNLDHLELFSKIIRSFSRDTPLRERYMDFNHTLNTYDWINPWIKSYLLETALLIICLLISILSVVILLLILVWSKKISLTKNFYFFLFVCALSLGLWFQAPEIRFGYGYIISFSLLLLAAIFKITIKNFQFFSKQILNSLLIIIISLNLLKNSQNFDKLNKSIEHNFNYNNFILISKKDDYEVYKPPATFNCGFFDGICVYQNGKYSVSSKLNYLKFIKK